MQLYFPPIECIRSALAAFRPRNAEQFSAETNIPEYWSKAFLRQGLGAKHPSYEKITTIVNWLNEKHGVTFHPDGSYTVRPKTSVAA